MAGRRADPDTRYRVYKHKDKQYTYAAVQEPKKTLQDGKCKNTTVHLGNLDENLKFIPNYRFRLLDPDEQKKYIFPDTWDISSIKNQDPNCDKIKNNASNTESVINNSSNKMENSNSHNNINESEQTSESNLNNEKDNNSLTTTNNQLCDSYYTYLYGSFWLIEQIAKKIGLTDDLLKTFDNNIFIVNEILSLAIFPYVSGKNYSRFAKWQKTHKTLVDYQLTSSAITKLSQKITDHHRMSLIKYRLEREPEKACLACDSTTRSAWGKCLADIRWGKNKDNEKLQNTLEVVVYSLTTHQPIYYRTFAGNTSDISTIRTILSDLNGLGVEIHDIIFVFDRGYISEENIASFVAADLSFLMCAKVNTAPVSQLLMGINYDCDGFPINMEFDKDTKLFISQITVPQFISKLPDGTEIRIEGLKANIFLDLSKRMEEITFIKIKMQEEFSILQNALRDQYIPQDIKKYNALFEYYKVSEEKDSNGNVYKIAFSECTEKIKKEKSRCGFFSSLMYNVDKNGKEALEQYCKRDEQEKSFDLLKNQMYFYVQRNSTEDGKNGRSFIAFTGMIPISYLKNIWSTSIRDKYISTLDVLDEMESIRYSQYPNQSGHMTTFTMKQVEICRACGIEPPYECLPATLKKESDRKNNPKKRGRKKKYVSNLEIN